MEKLVSCIYLKEKEKKNLVPDPPTTWLCQWFKQVWCYKKNKKNKTIRILLAGFTLIIIILLCQSQKNDEKLEQGWDKVTAGGTTDSALTEMMLVRR